MKKKYIVCCMSLLLVSCVKQESSEPKEPIHFLFATPLSTHTLWLQARDGMETACEELEVYCDWKGPTSIDTKEMDDVIYTGLLQKANGIITQGVIDPELIEQGRIIGIPFVLVDSGIKDSKPLATITKNFTQQAELLLADIEATLGKDEKLYIGLQVSELTFDLAQQQIEAVKQVFQKHPGGFEITAISESKSDKLHAREEWQKVLDRKMNVALNFAGEGASGCVEAMNAADLKKDLLIYGVDDMNDTMNYIRQKKVKGSIVTSFYKYGYDAVYLLYDAYTKDLPLDEGESIAADLLMLNQENIDTYQKELNK